MSGPARGRRRRVSILRAALPCLALLALDQTLAQAQTITPDLFRPVRDGFVLPQDSPLRRISDKPGDNDKTALRSSRAAGAGGKSFCSRSATTRAVDSAESTMLTCGGATRCSRGFSSG